MSPTARQAKPRSMYYYHPLDKVFITQGFGANPQVYKRFGLAGHDGRDYRTVFADSPLGHRYVSAAADGIVELVRNDGVKGYGLHVRVRHADGALTIYGHLSKTYAVQGKKILAQEILGLSGNSGFSTGPHLHFELRPAGWEKNTNNGFAGATDPTPFMTSVLPKQFM